MRAFTNAILKPQGGSFFADIFGTANVVGMYSLGRKMKASATSAFQTRRDDNAHFQDCSFSGENIDTSALASEGSGTTLRVETIYDQSGNGNHFTKVAGTNGGEIYRAGAVVTVNGKPAMDTQNWATAYELPTGLLNGATALTYIHVVKVPDHNNAGVFGPSNTNSVGLEVLQVDVIALDTLLKLNGTNRNTAVNRLFGDNLQSLTEIYGDGSSVAAYYNGAAVTLSSSAAMPSLNFNGVYSWGKYNSGAETAYGYYQELIIFSDSKVASRASIAANINAFYSIY